jgi:hypothetical protein
VGGDQGWNSWGEAKNGIGGRGQGWHRWKEDRDGIGWGRPGME